MTPRTQFRWALALLFPGLGLLAAFVLVPMVLTGWISLHDWSMYTGLDEAQYVGLTNFREIFADPTFRRAALNSLTYSGLSLAALLPLALLIGILLYQSGLRGEALGRTVLFLPYVIPTLTSAIVWGYLYTPLYGPLNQILAALGLPKQSWLGSPQNAMLALVIFNVWQTLGYYTVLVGAGLTQIPRMYYESAALDGAGPWAQIRHITLPLLSRVLFFVVVISLINTLQVFDPIYVLTQGGPSESTTVLSYYIYKTAFEFGLAGKASAMAFVLLAVLVLMVLLLLRSFTRPAEEV
jgi:ABC-type sugar transport system permease subunit